MITSIEFTVARCLLENPQLQEIDTNSFNASFHIGKISFSYEKDHINILNMPKEKLEQASNIIIGLHSEYYDSDDNILALSTGKIYNIRTLFIVSTLAKEEEYSNDKVNELIGKTYEVVFDHLRKNTKKIPECKTPEIMSSLKNEIKLFDQVVNPVENDKFMCKSFGICMQDYGINAIIKCMPEYCNCSIYPADEESFLNFFEDSSKITYNYSLGSLFDISVHLKHTFCKNTNQETLRVFKKGSYSFYIDVTNGLYWEDNSKPKSVTSKQITIAINQLKEAQKVAKDSILNKMASC